MLRTILLHAPLHATRPDRGPAAAALALATAHGASVTALLFDYQGAMGGTADPESARVQLESAAQASGVTVRALTTHSHARGIHEVVADHARLHDLVVAGTDDRGLLSERQVSEYLLFESGRPVMLVPGDAAAFDFRKAAVAWDGSRAAARALGDAQPLLVEAEQVALLHLGDDKELDTSLEPGEIEAALRNRGIPADFVSAERDSRPIAQALADEAIRLGAGVLVMGAYTRSRLSERLLGGATRGTLDRPLLPTILSH